MSLATLPVEHDQPLEQTLPLDQLPADLGDGCRLGEIQEGDLIFANRGFWLQRLCDLAGDPWLHVGIAAVVDDRLSIVEVGPDGCGSRPLADIVGGYRMMGVGRLPMGRTQCPCRFEVVEWATAQIGKPMVYAWDELNMAGFGALFSRILGSVPRRKDRPSAVAERLARVYRQRDSEHLFCSSFVTAALERCCERCRPNVEPFTIASTIVERMHHEEIGADAARVAESKHSDLVRRVFTTPTDFWRAADTQRSVLLDCPDVHAMSVA